ncbi:MAG: Hsp33 family molecular chaperone HslO [Clostridiales bacterium]|nr:MAG: Hsp33 family molecular chaperone HslO [Clostridiales bacterium]
MLLDKTILVSVISAKELVDKAIKIHSLSRTAAAALGRTLIVGAYMGTELKDDKQKLSITINGGGPLGRIVVLSDYGAKVRGYVENPAVELPLNGKRETRRGRRRRQKNGYISVIKDLGLKEPYSGRCPIVDGEIANDFAYYFTVSEQQPSAVALGVLAADNECVSAGGIFVSALPGADDNAITVMEDILTNFTRVSDLFKEMTPEDIIDRYFFAFRYFFIFPTCIRRTNARATGRGLNKSSCLWGATRRTIFCVKTGSWNLLVNSATKSTFSPKTTLIRCFQRHKTVILYYGKSY